MQFDLETTSSTSDSPSKSGMLSFDSYFGALSVATKWLVSVLLAMVQDALITRPGTLAARALIEKHFAGFFKIKSTRRSALPKLATSSTSTMGLPPGLAPDRVSLVDALAMQQAQAATDVELARRSPALFQLGSLSRELWVLLRTVCALYMFAVSPLRWGFYGNSMDMGLIADYVIDLWFCVDLVFRALFFHRVARNANSSVRRLCFQPEHIFLAFFQSSPVTAVLATLATFPLDVLLIPADIWRVLYWLRMFKLAHLASLPESLRYLFQHGRFVPRWKSLVDPILPTVFTLLALLVAAAHLFACGMWLLGSNNFSNPNWASLNPQLTAPVSWFTSGARQWSPASSLADQYLVSLYFVLYTLITVPPAGCALCALS
jgi:hypothetical protein